MDPKQIRDRLDELMAKVNAERATSDDILVTGDPLLFQIAQLITAVTLAKAARH